MSDTKGTTAGAPGGSGGLGGPSGPSRPGGPGRPGAPGGPGAVNPPNLRISSLGKSFGGVRALDGVDLTVPAGQVHALLGHNGAGKSTLIKCLGGAFPPDSGTIEVGGVAYARLSPRESIAAGVAIIFQTLSVVDSLTVAENIFLGQEWTRYGRVDRRAQEKVAAELLGRVAASCSPRDRVGELPMGQKQLVEIAKALSRSASVLVLDEPTAALSGTESEALAGRVEDLRTQGLAIVYVTHLLAEVERLADAVTVLRDGRVTHTATGVHHRHDLVRAIAGAREGGPPATTGTGPGVVGTAKPVRRDATTGATVSTEASGDAVPTSDGVRPDEPAPTGPGYHGGRSPSTADHRPRHLGGPPPGTDGPTRRTPEPLRIRPLLPGSPRPARLAARPAWGRVHRSISPSGRARSWGCTG
ncbi:ATP-binding cassette domain-containing protein [Streptomyces sp. MNU76]|uniref:ATP-binding cassette domain-containing protein n=1 Tax=Streptomyces sp. MNU76 TaxID=2560026 RepID=UPI001E3A7F48|nr:ATP-binding cassette domain-containing protein [Streptomyces sp. MNU76]MCC9711071.1 ATP-binding cassette domain-containing protein [Streptomyces sp. MNU76]